MKAHTDYINKIDSIIDDLDQLKKEGQHLPGQTTDTAYSLRHRFDSAKELLRWLVNELRDDWSINGNSSSP